MDFIPRIHITGISSRIDKSFAKGRQTHHMDYMFKFFTFNNKLISESSLLLTWRNIKFNINQVKGKLLVLSHLCFKSK